MWKYKRFFKGSRSLEEFSLGEGNTPLLKSKWIGPSVGLENLYFKLETGNPTGSYKDRFASLAMADILSKKVGICLATSSGNTGAALAAYAAASGVPCKIAIVDGAPHAKLRQMLIYGAELFMVKGFGIDSKTTSLTFEKLSNIAINHSTKIQVSAYKYCPIGMEGVETISFELAEQLPALRHVFVPAGGGGLTLAIAKGFQKWAMEYSGFESPRIHCVQPEGNDTIAGNLRKGISHAQPVTKSLTSISGLQVANVIDGDQTIRECRNSGGDGFLVEDRAVFKAQKLLALKEGIYTEPAGAVALTGVFDAIKEGKVSNDDKIVVIVSGSGFKDIESSDRMIANLIVNKINDLDKLASHFEN